jgi:hypothetical protein
VNNETPSVPGPLWGLWTQQTSLSASSDLGTLGATNLVYCSWPRTLHATNLPRCLVILANFGEEKRRKKLPQTGSVWGPWKQQTYPSPCSCLGLLDTKILPQLLVLSGALGHNKPTLALPPNWDLWTQRIQTQKTLQWIRTQIRQFHQTFRCNILIVLQEWTSKPTKLTAKLNL